MFFMKQEIVLPRMTVISRRHEKQRNSGVTTDQSKRVAADRMAVLSSRWRGTLPPVAASFKHAACNKM